MRTLILILLPFLASGQIYIDSYRFQGAAANLLLDDYPGAAAAYSLRLLDKDYTGYAIMVRRNNGDSTNIGFSNNYLDTTSLKSFCGTGATDSCFVRIWFDQSGNGRNASQTTNPNQPIILRNGSIIYEYGSPAVDFVSDDYLSTDSFSINQPIHQFGVGRISPSYSTSTSYTFASSSNAINRVHFFYRNTGLYAIFARNTIQSGIPTSSIHFLFSALFNGANSECHLNSSSIITGNAGAQNFGGSLELGTQQSGSLSWLGTQQEFIMYGTDQSSNRSGIESNINSFYSIY